MKKAKRGEKGWKIIIASGPVIIENGKILLSKDAKDDFYKLPGGSVKLGKESLEQGCKRRVKEEVNGNIEIIHPLDSHVLWKNPSTKEPMIIVLVNYLSKLKNKNQIKPGKGIVEIKWVSVKDIINGKFKKASPNTIFTLKTMGKRKWK